MLLVETARLVQKYPLSFLALGAAAALAMPVAAVTMAGALRPWARRILAGSVALRREAQRIAAESRESYADLLAEAAPPIAPDAPTMDEGPTFTPQRAESPRSQRSVATEAA